MSSTFLHWVAVGEMVLVELPLAVVAFGAVSNAFYISPLHSLVWRIIAFLLNLIAWLVVCFYFYPKMSASKAQLTRGDALDKVHYAYFFIPIMAHLLMVALWISHRVQFAGLSPLNFFTNIDAFHVLRSIETIGLILFITIASFWFYDKRHRALRMLIVKPASHNSSSPPQQQQT